MSDHSNSNHTTQQQQYQQNQGGYYDQSSQYGYPNYQQPGMPPQFQYIPAPRTNTKAIVGLVLGICSIVLVGLGLLIGIAGIIVSAMSMKEIPRKQESGKGLAVAGLICSIVSVVVYTPFVIFYAFVIIFAVSSGFSDMGNSIYY